RIPANLQVERLPATPAAGQLGLSVCVERGRIDDVGCRLVVLLVDREPRVEKFGRDGRCRGGLILTLSGRVRDHVVGALAGAVVLPKAVARLGRAERLKHRVRGGLEDRQRFTLRCRRAEARPHPENLLNDVAPVRVLPVYVDGPLRTALRFGEFLKSLKHAAAVGQAVLAAEQYTSRRSVHDESDADTDTGDVLRVA